MTRKNPRTGWGLTALFGTILLAGGVGGGVAWANYAMLSSAVMASGNVAVVGQPKSVQHLDGGIVSKIAVSQGDAVRQGQLLIALDATTIDANLKIYERRLRSALVQRARLQAELDRRNAFALPVAEAGRFDLGDLSTSGRRQREMMEARAVNRESERAQYDEKLAQFGNQIAGVQGLMRQKVRQLEGYKGELASLKTLVSKGLAPKSRLLALERAEGDIRGQVAEHISEIARIQNSIAEARLAQDQIAKTFREKVLEELETVEGSIDELVQQLQSTRAQLSRIEIRAPVSGTIHELNVFTIGGVVQPGQTVMQIVPASRDHELEVFVDPQSIDEIRPGQPVTIRFPAFHQSKTPELFGSVGTISPASVVDEQSGVAFYRVIVSLPPEQEARLDGKALIPGMPVEAQFPTGERSVLSYLVKPLGDSMTKAFREE